MDIASIGTTSATTRIAAIAPEFAGRDTRNTRNGETTSRNSNIQDVVEVSPQARKAAADIRSDLVDRVKLEIQFGTYENLKKLDTAIDRMMSDLLD